MDTVLYVNLSSQVALRRKLDVLANNIANVDTRGFRAERSYFADYLAKGGDAGALAYVIDRATFTDFKEGAFNATQRDLDFAIDGQGFFAVQTPDGVRYTRDGSFQITNEGLLTTDEGFPVLNNGFGEITIPFAAASPQDGSISIVSDNIDLSGDGNISGNQNLIGQVGVFEFQDPQALNRQPGQMFASDAQGTPVNAPQLLQGFLEESNVNAITEMVTLLDATRAYTSSARMANDVSQLKRRSIQRLGTPSG